DRLPLDHPAGDREVHGSQRRAGRIRLGQAPGVASDESAQLVQEEGLPDPLDLDGNRRPDLGHAADPLVGERREENLAADRAARSAWSSARRGAPKKATIPSPTNSLMVPPCSTMMSVIPPRYWFSTSTTTAGSPSSTNRV